MPPLLDSMKRILRVKPATRYPADPRAVFVLSLAILTSIPLLVAKVGPGSLEELMPMWAVLLWGWGLAIGSVVTLAGMSRQDTAGVIAEQIGSVTVGVTTALYGAGAMLVGGEPAIQGGAIIIGFGLSCLYRWLQLQEYLRGNQDVVDAIRRGEDPKEVLTDRIIEEHLK